MSLHDRIMALPVTFCSGPDGWTIASEAAGIAKEADELMAEMADHINQLIAAIESDDIIYESIVDRHLARECLEKYYTYQGERK